MEEESLKNFINSIIFLVKLFAGLKDKFLAQKLYDKMSGFIAGYIKLFALRGENDIMSYNSDFVTSKDFAKSQNIVQHKTYVAQYSALIEFKNSIDSLLELLDYLEHSKSTSTTPLLYARKNLLNLKLELIKLHQQPIQSVPKPKESKSLVSFVPKNNRSKSLKENSNKERILNFIKHSPNSRTKDIIEEFSILSGRTVKRNLKELIMEGVVRKLAKDNRVYYSVI